MKHIEKLARAEEQFLLARGWEKKGDDEWREPQREPEDAGLVPPWRRTLHFGHAVNSEKLRRGVTPELREAEVAYLEATGWKRSAVDPGLWCGDGHPRHLRTHSKALNRQKYLDRMLGGRFAQEATDGPEGA